MDDAAAIFASPRLTITLEALTRAYDHLVIDGGAMTETPIALLCRYRAACGSGGEGHRRAAKRRTLARNSVRPVSRMWSAIQGGAGKSGAEPVAA